MRDMLRLFIGLLSATWILGSLGKPPLRPEPGPQPTPPAPPPGQGSFLGRVLAGIGAEFRAIAAVVPLLRWPFWVAWVGLLPLALIGLAPGLWSWAVQAGALLFFGLAGLLSGRVARLVRRRGWVRYPDGPHVVPFLPQLLTLLSFPHFLAAMMVLFWKTGALLPGGLGASGWNGALLQVLDNLLRCQLLFHAADIYHWRLQPVPAHRLGSTVVFVSRLLFNLAFVKLAVQVLNAAIHRARGLGRGEDVIYQTKKALGERDATRVRYLAQAVDGTLRTAVDSLCAHTEGSPESAAEAWRCLVVMRDFALPYLEDRLLSTHEDARGSGDPVRARLARLRDRLQSATAEEARPPRHRLRWWLLPALAAGLAAVLFGLYQLPVLVAIPAAGGLVGLFGWMVIGSRGWIDRLVRWRALRPVAPGRLPLAVTLWAVALGPGLVLAAARLFHALSGFDRGMFHAAAGAADFPAVLGYVLGNLLHTSIFLDFAEVYDIHVARLEAVSVLGCTLTFITRTIFDLGIIALVTSVALVWFNRVVRRFPVSPNAELTLRQQAQECGPHASLLIAYHHAEIRAFFVASLRKFATNQELFTALAGSGFLADLQKEYAPAASCSASDARRHLGCGRGLRMRGRYVDGAAELRRAVAILEPHARDTRGEDKADLARAWNELSLTVWYQYQMADAEQASRRSVELFQELLAVGEKGIQGDLGWARSNLGIALQGQGQLSPAEAEYRAAIDLYKDCIAAGKDLRRELAEALGSLGTLLAEQHRSEEAVQAQRATIALYQELIREGQRQWRDQLALAHSNLASSLGDLGRLQEKVDELRKALALLDELLKDGEQQHRGYQGFIQSILGSALQEQGLLEASAVELHAAVATLEQEVQWGRRDLRAWLAMAYRVLAGSLRDLGRLEDAAAAFRHALAIRQQLAASSPEQQRELGWTGEGLGIVLRLQGRLPAAAEAMQQAVTLFETLLRQNVFDMRRDLARGRIWLGVILRDLGKLPEAEALLRQGLDGCQKLQQEGLEALDTIIAMGQTGLGWCLFSAGQPSQAIKVFEEARATYTRLLAHNRPELRKELGWCYTGLGWAHQACAQLPGAGEAFTKAIDLFAELVKEGQWQFETDLADARVGLGCVRLDEGRFEAARAELEQALAKAEQLVAGGRPELRLRVAVAYLNRGKVWSGLGDLARAETDVRRAVAGLNELVAEGQIEHEYILRNSQVTLALYRQRLGHVTEAEALLNEVIASLRRLIEGGRNDLQAHLTFAYYYLSPMLRDQGKLDEAVGVAQKAIGGFEFQVEKGGRSEMRKDLALARHQLALSYRQRGEVSAAIELEQGAVNLLQELVGEGRTALVREIADVRVALGEALRSMGRVDAACAECEQAIATYDKLVQEGRSDLRGSLAGALRALGVAHQARGDLEAATEKLRLGVLLLVELLGEGQRTVRLPLASCRQDLGQVLRDRGDLASALAEQQAVLGLLDELLAEGFSILLPHQARARMNLATLQRLLGQPAEALTNFRAAQAFLEPLAATRTDLRGDLIMLGLQMGYTLRDTGSLTEALTQTDRALGDVQSFQHPGGLETRPIRASLHTLRGSLYSNLGRFPESLREYQASVPLWQQLVDDSLKQYLPSLAVALRDLSQALVAVQKKDEALETIQAAIQIHRQLLDGGRTIEGVALAWSVVMLGRTLQARTERPAALAAFQEGIELLQDAVNQGQALQRLNLALAWNNVGQVQRDLGALDPAVQAFRQSLEELDRLERGGRADLSATIAQIKAALAGVLQMKQDWVPAAAEIQGSISRYETLVKDGRPDLRGTLATQRVLLGNILHSQKRYLEAVTSYERAAATMRTLHAETASNGSRRDLAVTCSNLAGSCQALGKNSEARAHYQESIKWYEQISGPDAGDAPARAALTRVLLGNLLYSEGQENQALDQYQAAAVSLEKPVQAGQLDAAAELFVAWQNGIVVAGPRQPARADAIARHAVAEIGRLAGHAGKLPDNARQNLKALLAVMQPGKYADEARKLAARLAVK